MSTDTLRELDCRQGDGVTVTLLWREADDAVVLRVDDERSEESFELKVARDRALDAFNHPFAYVAGRSLLPEAA